MIVCHCDVSQLPEWFLFQRYAKIVLKKSAMIQRTRVLKIIIVQRLLYECVRTLYQLTVSGFTVALNGVETSRSSKQPILL